MIYFRGVDAFETCLFSKRLTNFKQLFLGRETATGKEYWVLHIKFINMEYVAFRCYYRRDMLHGYYSF